MRDKRRSFDVAPSALLRTGQDRLTVNLAPSDIKKEGPSFDLPIAMGVLATGDAVSQLALENIAMVGDFP